MKFSIFSTCAVLVGSTLASPAGVSEVVVHRQDDNSLLSDALSALGDIASSSQVMLNSSKSPLAIIDDMISLTEMIEQLNTEVKPKVDSAHASQGQTAAVQARDLSLPSISDLLGDLLAFLQATTSIVQTVIQVLPAVESEIGAVISNLESAFGSLEAVVGSIVTLGETALQACADVIPGGICADIEQDISQVKSIIATLEQLWNEL